MDHTASGVGMPVRRTHSILHDVLEHAPYLSTFGTSNADALTKRNTNGHCR